METILTSTRCGSDKDGASGEVLDGLSGFGVNHKTDDAAALHNDEFDAGSSG